MWKGMLRSAQRAFLSTLFFTQIWRKTVFFVQINATPHTDTGLCENVLSS